ncbi:vacuolar protein sorting/targeting protein 10 [Dactylonectria macrodidyma]|uniref:Vacuolar protein sorting/targeting protein 10 n=1 Tax=Dactylonectria macrodidyma TaxID=307937 RepID=A0A9P9JPU6_9HYPO|nr:vacuolar protein sorting/targeting protein 10 [Dactylonectria macrodidyma]
MRFAGRAAAASWHVFLLSLFWTTVLAKEDAPGLKVTTLEHPPVGINYFEDSDVIVFHDVAENNIYRSDNAGVEWKRVADIPEGASALMVMHPFDSKTAFVLTTAKTHYKTTDQGKSWTEFKSGTLASAFQPEILVFHAGDPNRIIFNGMNCDGIFCDEEATYTLDGFKSVQQLRSSTAGCWWAKSTPTFTTGQKDLDNSRTMCIIADQLSFFKEDQRLYISDSFFAIEGGTYQQFEPNMNTNKGVSGVVNLAAVKKFILVASTSPNSDEMALYISVDTVHWHRAMFPADDSHDHSHQINQEAYTVLESTDYSLQVDVMTSHPSNPVGVIFTSNSNGTFFTENVPYTNRNANGHVDFEKISGIQGIFLVNVVENGKEVENSGAEKIIVTKMTFDDGRTFESIKSGEDTIHLHSITQLDNIGRVFSSPAPGLIMGNGNTGASLGPFIDSNLFVSDNAGVTWSKALDGPHKYEFGDSGSILLAIKDSVHEDVDQFAYSLDHGDHWTNVSLPDSLAIKPDLLTTTQDSTSLKFLLLGEKDKTYYMIAIDFSTLGKRTCEKKDKEDWYARVDDKGKPTCLMGHKQTYNRRKKSADCFVNSGFKDPVPETENCDCTDADFECDYNFQRDPEDRSVCKQAGRIPIPDGSCKKGSEGTFKGSSGWRLIPGNTCNRMEGSQKDDPVERKCSDGVGSGGGSDQSPGAPASGEVSHQKVDFGSKFDDFQKVYLDRSDSSAGSDETVIVRPVNTVDSTADHLWRTTDHGKTWNPILEKEGIVGIYPHDYFKDVIFFTTSDDKVIYTIDRGQSFHSFKGPTKADRGHALSFHPDKKDWIIWVGETCDDVSGNKDCFLEASISTDRGDNWKTMLRYVVRCEFTGHSAYKFRPLKQIVCLTRQEENNDSPKTIVSSDDFFDEDKKTFNGSIENFATMSEFILIAQKEGGGGELQALASVDGKHFEAAQFPFNFHDTHRSSYTVLDSSYHAINLFVATKSGEGRELGSIIKSNSNGTTYVLSASNINSNSEGYVDFEKVAGLEGVTLINVVTNPDKDSAKELQTQISHNDNAEWGFLPPPKKDADGKSYKCSSSNGDKKCALHLHNYSERDDKRKTFAASTAVGLLFGVGNVGSKLGDFKDADTFMTADGGITWKYVKKGHWTWQYGDQGGVIVLVQRATHGNGAKTKIVSYSTDEGQTWTDYEFAGEEVTVLDITTVSSGASRNFLLWCKSDKGNLFSVNLDFSGLTDKACEYIEGSKESDYDLWSPTHPFQDDDCVFGHVATYLRKKTGRKCYNKENLKRLHDYRNCECTRSDYECDYNYQLDNHGQCHDVPGLSPLTGQEWCKQNPNATTWFEPTGYRRLPMTTCSGGKEWDKTSTEHACAGYEDEFERRHRTSGWVIFFSIVIPACVAGAIGWYVYNNWNSSFGQIRLGDSSSTFDSDQPWIKYPVIAISALAAVVVSLPLVATSLWRTASGAYERVSGGSSGGSWLSGGGTRRFTTRDSFARGRGDYAVVDDDEGELLGEESDEEV